MKFLHAITFMCLSLDSLTDGRQSQRRFSLS